MKNTVFNAKLLPDNKVRLSFLSDFTLPINASINIVKNDNIIKQLKVEKRSLMGNVGILECSSPIQIEFGDRYFISIDPYGTCPLEVNDAPLFPGFDEKYYYSGNDLGATYAKDSTTFVLWAPISSSVFLKYSTDGGKTYKYVPMEREPKGTYRIKINENLDGAYYNYVVENSGVTRTTIDPYGKGSTANGIHSVVINPKQIRIDLEEKDLPTYENYVDCIIYECGVRDMTINDNTNIVNKGKYLGLSEEKRITKGGHPAGLDYIKFLGITHLQLLPIYDFKTVDEENPELSYNWGYDPMQYFVPEGSFCTNIKDPYSRIIELKRMVKALHHNKIKVNMDVVFNHVYEYQFSSFEAIVPNYYFRKNNNGTMSNGSFCGNDVASERKMVSKLIIDACLYWIKEFGIDGFRFDLMGIIDKFTIMKIYREAVKLKSDFMVYGEGWNMPTNLPDNQKASMDNAKTLPYIGFFNDTFRDIVKGPTGESDFQVPGYFTGDLSYRDGFKYAFLGACKHRLYANKFINANQSINYVECHDNGTLYDKVVASANIEEESSILRLICSINSVVLLSFGVPFIHMGQEIGQTKNMHQNTYKSGDKYNMMRYDLLDKRWNMAQYFSSITGARKIFDYAKEFRSEIIEKLGDYEDLDNGGIILMYHKPNSSKIDYYVVINPTSETYFYGLDNYVTQIVGEAGYIKNSKIKVKNLSIPGYSIYGYRNDCVEDEN